MAKLRWHCAGLLAGFWVAALEQSATGQSLPEIPGFTVTHYATVTDPIDCAFAPDGVLFTGRDASGSAGTTADAVPIHRIGVGGVPVMEYGPAFEDPDSVCFDVTGAISGVTGSVLVAGRVGPSGGIIRAVHPDFTASTIVPLSTSHGNPGMMRLDRTGRLLFVSNGPTAPGIWALPPGGTATRLISLSGGVEPAHFAMDSENRIYVSATDGVIRLYAANGSLLNDDVATGLTNANLLFGPGGGFGTDLWVGVANLGLFTLNTNTGQLTLRSSTLTNASDLVFGPDGAMYASQFNEDRILRIAPDSPPLSIVLTTTNTVLVSWPLSPAGFDLQQNADLGTTNWISPSEPVAEDTTNRFILVNPPTGQLLYRLFKSSP
jgi:hypothetical protein